MHNDKQSLDPSELAELIAFDLEQQAAPTQDPWRSVALGEKSADELIAARADTEDPDDLKRRAELFAPPSEEERRADLDAVLERCAKEPQQPGTVIPLEKRGRVSWWTIGGGLLAAAASAALVWRLIPSVEPGSRRPMPSFVVDWEEESGGSMRKADDGGQAPGACWRYQADGQLVVRLRPRGTLRDDVFVAAMAQQEGGKPKVLPIVPEMSDLGVITIEQGVAELGLTSGEWSMTIFVGHGDGLPPTDELLELRSGETPGIAVIRDQICIEE